MPTRRAKLDQIIDFDQILKAIKLVKFHGYPILTAANAREIPETTLRRYINKVDKANVDVSKEKDDVLKKILFHYIAPGPKPIFSTEQEEELANYLLRASAIYYGLSIKELRVFAYQYAKKIGVKYPPAWDKNGQTSREYYYAFMNRHRSLSLRSPEQISQYRAKSFNKENVDSFFQNLSAVLETPYPPSRIWNMDETGIATVPTKIFKVIGKKGARNVGQKTSQERGTTVSVAVAVSASGQFIPPMYIFPRSNMKQTYLTHAAPGTVGYANGGGWMTAEYFVKFMNHFIQHSGAKKGSPTLLLLDNHTSHQSIETLDLAAKHDITMLSFPPHCTHKMQPLDVSVFSSFKNVICQQHNAWQKNNIGVRFDLHHVPLVAEEALDIAATPKNIKSGFRATGIFPFNPNIFSESDFVAAEISDENLFGTENEDPEDQRRNVVTGPNVASSTAAHDEAITPESSPMPSTSSLATTTPLLREALKSVGPLKTGTPVKKSNRGRKPMKSMILTSPENVIQTRQRQMEKIKKEKGKIDKTKKKNTAKKQPKRAKRAKKIKVEEDSN